MKSTYITKRFMYQKTEGFLVLYLLRCFGGEGSLSISRIHTQMLRMYGVFTYIRWKKGHIQREMEVNIPYIGVHLGIQLTPLKFNMVHLKIKSLEVWWFRIWFKPSFSGEACWISGEYIFKKKWNHENLEVCIADLSIWSPFGIQLTF